LHASSSAASVASSSSIQAARLAWSAESIEDGSRAEQSRGCGAAAPWCAAAVGDGRPRAAIGNGRPRAGIGNGRPTATGQGRRSGSRPSGWRRVRERASEGVARGLGRASFAVRAGQEEANRSLIFFHQKLSRVGCPGSTRCWLRQCLTHALGNNPIKFFKLCLVGATKVARMI
jgi:hypothetical protein